MRKEDRILRGIALMSLAYCALAILFLILLLGYLAKNPDGTLGELLSEWDRRLPGGVKAFLGRFSGFHLYLGACFAATYDVRRAM